MYDTQLVLNSIELMRWPILALCGFAMICNYTWFIEAVVRGFRDQVYPVPVFCTLFWLVGDGSMVLRYDLWFNVIDHWYVKLFWAALVLTVACELILLYMTIRFGRRELAPSLSQAQFTALMLAGVGMAALIWEFVKSLIGDELYINYFHLANFVGPVFAAGLVLRRNSRAGSSATIWIAYTLMIASWFVACALWFGEPFARPGFILFYVAGTLASAVMIKVVASVAPYANKPAA